MAIIQQDRSLRRGKMTELPDPDADHKGLCGTDKALLIDDVLILKDAR
jgi:hypothetical protein